MGHEIMNHFQSEWRYEQYVGCMDSINEDGWIVDGDGTAYFRDPYELFVFVFSNLTSNAC